MTERMDGIPLLEGIMTTRAIRTFTDDPVSDQEIFTCLRAAQQAPSGGNSQPWQYLVVTAPVVREAVASIYRRAFDRWERAQLRSAPRFRDASEEDQFTRGLRAARRLSDNLGSAAALVLFLMPSISLAPVDDDGPVDIGPLYASVYPAVQNFMLAARSLGIGTVLTTVWWSRQADLRESLGIPERYEIVALVPMGRPTGDFGVAPRRRVVAHWDRFGNRRPDDRD